MSPQDITHSGNVSLAIFILDRNQSDPGPFDSVGLIEVTVNIKNAKK